MQPSGIMVLGCPDCGGVGTYQGCSSWNTLGARQWTDGWISARMKPDLPQVVQCIHCDRAHWIRDAVILEKYSSYKVPESAPEEWRRAAKVKSPDEQEYYNAIREGLGRDQEHDLQLRTLVWHVSNHPYREPAEGLAPPPESGERWDNLCAMLALLEDGEGRVALQKAEVLRQLGRWQESLAALEQVNEPDYEQFVLAIRAGCQARNTLVIELPRTE
ncbi:MAG: hypothetical protein IPK64_18740 [bacterium]|nr:hypothetical protein [bacterium]